MPHALDLLASDHERVSDLFDQVEDAETIERKREIFANIRFELETHARIEETVFYPAVENMEGASELVAHSFEDHQDIKDLIASAQTADDDDEFEECLYELMDCVEDHVDEEENELFPKVEDMMSEFELNQLGDQLLATRGDGEVAA